MTAETSLPKMSQRAIASLIVLMATARELPNPELSELSGFVLDGGDRRQLNELGLVTSRRLGRAYAHALTEEGWRAARGLLGAERPAKAGSFGGALYALLAGVGAGLDRAGLSPLGFFGASPAGDPPQAEEAVESAIRSAYADLAEKDGDWVGLAPLRARLGAYSRADVDRALRSLVVQPGVHIVPVANLKSLTSADREAALRLGGEDNHAIAIEAR